MNTIDKEALRLLRTELNKAVEAVAKAHGVKLEFGSGTYGEDRKWGKLTLEIRTIGENGVVETRERAAFKVNAELLGLKAEDLDKEIMHSGRIYKIVGANPKSYRFPIIVADTSGKTYKMSVDFVKFGLQQRAKQ